MADEREQRTFRLVRTLLLAVAALLLLAWLAALASTTFGGSKPLDAAISFFDATGLDAADYYVAKAGHHHGPFGLQVLAHAEFARRDDDRGRVVVRVTRWPFCEWQLQAIERH